MFCVILREQRSEERPQTRTKCQKLFYFCLSLTPQVNILIFISVPDLGKYGIWKGNGQRDKDGQMSDVMNSDRLKESRG